MERLMADLRALEEDIRADARASSSARDGDADAGAASPSPSPRRAPLGIRVDAAATARDDARDGARTLDATRGNFRRARVALERACAEVSAREAVELARARALGAMATTTAVRGKTRASGDATNAAGEKEARETEEKATRVARRA